MKLQSLKNAMRLGRGEGLVSGAWGVGRKIVHDDADAVRIGIVRIGEIAHAVGKIAGGPVIGHLHMTPGLVRIEEDEQIRCSVAFVFAIVSLGSARRGRDRQTGLADQPGRAFVEANYRALRIVVLGVQVEHVLHAGDVSAVDSRNTPHVFAPASTHPRPTVGARSRAIGHHAL
jgi:hypothetical protein